MVLLNLRESRCSRDGRVWRRWRIRLPPPLCFVSSDLLSVVSVRFVNKIRGVYRERDDNIVSLSIFHFNVLT